MFATGFPVTPLTHTSTSFGYWIFGVSFDVKYRILDEGVEEVNVGVIKKLVDEPTTTFGAYFSVLHCIRLPSLMSCGF